MTDKNIAIRVRNPGKKYILGGSQEKYLSLRDAIVNSVKARFICSEVIWHMMKSGFFREVDIYV